MSSDEDPDIEVHLLIQKFLIVSLPPCRWFPNVPVSKSSFEINGIDVNLLIQNTSYRPPDYLTLNILDGLTRQ
ncbi:unnamed protein product [Macrosiphum euphorbiae]|uniref:Uncharacterized protein n=1 Tax=Macrosiphum euphorbiae TaxID=13131 RepID=A0AAV0XPC7_9HEMI|nr:unnamed protein product [Macrosiphum euphorbiae]